MPLESDRDGFCFARQTKTATSTRQSSNTITTTIIHVSELELLSSSLAALPSLFVSSVTGCVTIAETVVESNTAVEVGASNVTAFVIVAVR